MKNNDRQKQQIETKKRASGFCRKLENTRDQKAKKENREFNNGKNGKQEKETQMIASKEKVRKKTTKVLRYREE